jgi:hypothetical protein
MRKTTCRYPTQAPRASPVPNGSDVSTQLNAINLPAATDVALPSTWTQGDDMNLEPLPDFLQSAFDTLTTPHQQLFHGTISGMGSTDVIPFNRGSPNLADNSICTIEPVSDQHFERPTDAQTAALARHSMELVFRVMRTWPRMLAEDFQLPPLIHPTQRWNKELPLPLAHCITLAKMWYGQCEGAEEIVRATILKEVDCLLEHVRALSRKLTLNSNPIAQTLPVSRL